MRKLNLTLLGLSIVVLLVVAVVTVPGFGRIKIRGIMPIIVITKTYDLYYVNFEEAGEANDKRLYSADGAATRSTVGNFIFDQEDTDYTVEIKDLTNNTSTGAIGYIPGIVFTHTGPADAFGRIRYQVIIRTTNPGKVLSALTGAILVLGVVSDGQIGSEYEQEHWDEGIFDVNLPEDNPDIGANVILCPAPSGELGRK